MAKSAGICQREIATLYDLVGLRLFKDVPSENDKAHRLLAGMGDDVIMGGSNTDVIVGNGGNDWIGGGAGGRRPCFARLREKQTRLDHRGGDEQL